MTPTLVRKLPAVLVVDDEVRSQEALRRTLDEDFVVFCAGSAAEGLEILEQEQSLSAIRVTNPRFFPPQRFRMFVVAVF